MFYLLEDVQNDCVDEMCGVFGLKVENNDYKNAYDAINSNEAKSIRQKIRNMIGDYINENNYNNLISFNEYKIFYNESLRPYVLQDEIFLYYIDPDRQFIKNKEIFFDEERQEFVINILNFIECSLPNESMFESAGEFKNVPVGTFLPKSNLLKPV